nr:PREDICTED: uncharacterized protein LOC106703069 [Latimeria chalumnae]|eukprot:XP_014342558.1 PREDICTED: uncharacterized protein LOC106703069 [Latimeria chalumnae]
MPQKKGRVTGLNILDFYKDSGTSAGTSESAQASPLAATGKRGSLADDMRLGFATIQTGLADLHSEVSSINKKLDDISLRLDASERRIGDIENRVDHIENMILEVHWLCAKCDDLENRARCSNLHLGLQEGIEGKDPVSFMEKLLVEVLEEETFPGRVEIERAHRAL